MTPLEIIEYKRNWMPGKVVRLHSDLRSTATAWCKQLGQHEYNFAKYTDVYEDTFYFENEKIGQIFEEEFLRWVIKNQMNNMLL